LILKMAATDSLESLANIPLQYECLDSYLFVLFIFKCSWVDTRWQQYSTHLHTNSTQVDTRWQQYSTHLHTNSTKVDTRWQQYSTHLHTNSTQNAENGTYITTTKLGTYITMINFKTNLGSAGRAPSLPVIPCHLPYN
jgi:hypothetical protein